MGDGQVPDTKTMMIQLLSKDESAAYDAEILAERWQTYIDSYVSVGRRSAVMVVRAADDGTGERDFEGALWANEKSVFEEVRGRARGSLILTIYTYRNLPHAAEHEPAPRMAVRAALEMRICIRTYRIFYVPGTEDYLEWEEGREGERKWGGEARERRRRWVEREMGERRTGVMEEGESEVV